MGAWIEMYLKSLVLPIVAKVAPLVGAWIEIKHPTGSWQWNTVAPLVGAWIEIL